MSESVDLVTHNDIVVRASARQIWPYIVDPTKWKSAVRLIAVDGAPCGIGRRYRAAMPNDRDNVLFLVEDVEWFVERRRTIRLNEAEGALIGFSSWELTPAGRATKVTYDVYCQLQMPDAVVSEVSTDRSSTREDFHLANHRRFAEELTVLKRLVEGGTDE